MAISATLGTVLGAVGSFITANAAAIGAVGALAGVGVAGASGAGAFDPKMPDPNAAKKAEREARRKKMIEMGQRRGRGASLVTGGSGLSARQEGGSLGQSGGASLLGGP